MEAGPEASRAAQVTSLPVPDICARRLVISGAGIASVKRTASFGAMADVGSVVSTAVTSLLPSQAMGCMGSRLECKAVAAKEVATRTESLESVAAGSGVDAATGAKGGSAGLAGTVVGGIAEAVGSKSASGAATSVAPGAEANAGTAGTAAVWGTDKI